MTFLVDLLLTPSVPQSILVFSIAIAAGLALGNLKFFGIQLRVAGVLFSGIVLSSWGLAISPEVLEFAKNFGLILFVYTIGIEVGPGFFSNFKKEGLAFNAAAVFVVVLGGLEAVAFFVWAHIPAAVAVGMFSGATTNTPSLGAAQQILKEMPSVSIEIVNMPGLGYAIAYPMGVLGVILTMILIRKMFRIDLAQEAAPVSEGPHPSRPPLNVVDLLVENKVWEDAAVDNIPQIQKGKIVVSRVFHQGSMEMASGKTRLHVGDVVRVVGAQEDIAALSQVIGPETKMDMRGLKQTMVIRRVIVTRTKMDGKTIEDLDVRNRYGVTITRVIRSGVEFLATPDTQIRYADTLLVVGDEDLMEKFAAEIGNAPRQVEQPLIIPIFVGIALGVVLGSWPIPIPGIPSPIKLGLAGGPLIVAIVLSKIGRIGNLVWFLPASAGFMLRDLGITLFLTSVGFSCGEKFVSMIVHGQGLYWMACASFITFVPIVVTGIFLRMKYRVNYFTLCGLLAGSMTNPPALAFINNLTASNAASVGYATVYPVVMVLRIVMAQLLVLALVR